MTSDKQAESNRRNSKKSTGPRTPEGKKRMAQNAVTHGLTASDPFIQDEDPAGFNERLERFTEDWEPPDETERFLVKRLAVLSLRVDRGDKAELAALMATQREAAEDLRDVQQRDEDALRQDLIELGRSMKGFIGTAREEDFGFSASQVRQFHWRQTLQRVWCNPAGIAYLVAVVDRVEAEITTTQAMSADTVINILHLFAVEEPTLLQRIKGAMSADAAFVENAIPSLSVNDATAALTVLRAEQENLAAQLGAMERRRTEERDLARAAIHLPSEETVDRIQRYETHASREFHRIIALLLLLQKERTNRE
jgi:hypothetical protein